MKAVELDLGKAKKHTKSTLKGLFRVKPTADSPIAGEYKSDYGKYVTLYYLEDCKPMRALSNKPRSEAQIKATENLVRDNFYNSGVGRAVLFGQSLIESEAVVIDFETTDLRDYLLPCYCG